MQNQSGDSDNSESIENLSIGKAAKYLGVSVDTLRRWERKGRLTPERSPGGHRYFKKEGLEKLFDKKYSRDTLPKVEIQQSTPSPSFDTTQLIQTAKPSYTEFPIKADRPKIVVEEETQQQIQMPTMEKPETLKTEVTVPTQTETQSPVSSTYVSTPSTQNLSPEMQERLKVILADNQENSSMTTFQKAAIIGLTIFVVLDVVLVYLWYTSIRIISPIP